jgi:hypothetical protein
MICKRRPDHNSGLRNFYVSLKGCEYARQTTNQVDSHLIGAHVLADFCLCWFERSDCAISAEPPLSFRMSLSSRQNLNGLLRLLRVYVREPAVTELILQIFPQVPQENANAFDDLASGGAETTALNAPIPISRRLTSMTFARFSPIASGAFRSLASYLPRWF